MMPTIFSGIDSAESCRGMFVVSADLELPEKFSLEVEQCDLSLNHYLWIYDNLNIHHVVRHRRECNAFTCIGPIHYKVIYTNIIMTTTRWKTQLPDLL